MLIIGHAQIDQGNDRVAKEVLECYRGLRVEAAGLPSDELPARFTREFRERGLDTDALALRRTTARKTR